MGACSGATYGHLRFHSSASITRTFAVGPLNEPHQLSQEAPGDKTPGPGARGFAVCRM